MVYVFHKLNYKGSFDRLTKYESLPMVRAACIKKMKDDLKGSDWYSGVYVIRKEYFYDGFPGKLGVCGWMDGERAEDRKRYAFFYYTGKGGFLGKAGMIRIAENGHPYKSSMNRNIASVYNRTKSKRKAAPFGL